MLLQSPLKYGFRSKNINWAITMEIKEENYSISFEEGSGLVKIAGAFRLNGMDEYGPILDILKAAINSSDTMVVDMCELNFLNSSGIAMLSKFVIEARGKEGLDLTIKGSINVPWQGKSLKNLQRLFPALTLDIS